MNLLICFEAGLNSLASKPEIHVACVFASNKPILLPIYFIIVMHTFNLRIRQECGQWS